MEKVQFPARQFSVPNNGPWLNTEDAYTMVRTTSAPYFWW